MSKMYLVLKLSPRLAYDDLPFRGHRLHNLSPAGGGWIRTHKEHFLATLQQERVLHHESGRECILYAHEEQQSVRESLINSLRPSRVLLRTKNFRIILLNDIAVLCDVTAGDHDKRTEPDPEQ